MSIIKFFAIIFFNILDQFIHQKRILRYLKKNLNNIDIFFDVGSHKGTYTDLILKNFKTKKIFMFEPQIKIFKFIKNKYKNIRTIKLFNKAVSNDENVKNIYINQHDLTSSLTLLNKKNSYLNYKAFLFGSSVEKMIKKTHKIQTIKLKNIIANSNFKKIDLIKIDTEGHELQVILGIGKYIKNVNCILIEFHLDNIYLNYQPKKIHNFLIKNKFILKKRFKFPFTTWEDRIYVKKTN
jgi:FkbM family methyltransferase|tara:strand:+ start:22 stop:735 length:714 start_codon:yes stop_codon:yes gene_type:complete